MNTLTRLMMVLLTLVGCSSASGESPPGTQKGATGSNGMVGAGMGMSPVGSGGAAGTVGAGGTRLDPDQSIDADGGSLQHGDDGAGSAATQGTFTVLDYNVHGLPPLITGDDTPGRMTQIAPLLNNFDLVGVQEDFDAANHELLIAGNTHAFVDRYDDPLPDHLYGAGLAAFTPYKIVDSYRMHYSACFGALLGPGYTDCVSSKGFQVLRLALSTAPGAEIDFYNTHMDAGDGAEDVQAREVDIDELLKAMATYSAGRAIVFTGDTNAYVKQLSRLLDGAGLRDSCEEVGCPEPWHIERVLVRSSATLTVTVKAWNIEPMFIDAMGVPLSDHPAVSAHVAWEATGKAVLP